MPTQQSYRQQQPLVLQLLTAFAALAVIGVVAIFLITRVLHRAAQDAANRTAAQPPAQTEELPKPKPYVPQTPIQAVPQDDSSDQQLGSGRVTPSPGTAPNANQVAFQIIETCAILIHRSNAYVYTWRTTSRECKSQPEYFRQTGYGATADEAEIAYVTLVKAAAGSK